MAASLRGRGTVPGVRAELMVSVISGVREVRQALTRAEGIGSRGQVDNFMVESNSEGKWVVCRRRKCRLQIKGNGRGGEKLVMDVFNFGKEE